MTTPKEQAYENLRYKIITQKLTPGTLLKDKELMEEYGIGRTPLREIILRLQGEGLITRVARAGTWVAPMDFNFLQQITEIRVGIEGLAGELTTLRITPEQLAGLQEILDEADRLQGESPINYEALIRLESRFHSHMYEATGNPKLQELLVSYQGIGARFWHHIAYTPEELFRQFESQHAILDAIKAGDGKRCRTLMEEHIRSYMDIINDRLRVVNNLQSE